MAATVKGRPKPPPQFQLTGSISTFGANKLAREGHYIFADPSMSAAGRCGHIN
jgi:hypothetical protein